MKRFILLRDNRIIDTKKYIIDCETHSDAVILYRKGVYGKSILLTEYTVLKETDKLINLIEVNDWIELNDDDRTLGIKLNKFEYDAMLSNRKIIEKNLLKIYKPNKNRGYDLAWEREE